MGGEEGGGEVAGRFQPVFFVGNAFRLVGREIEIGAGLAP
jgi:hypothetical protein